MCGGGLFIEVYGLLKVGVYCDILLVWGDLIGEGILVGFAFIGGVIMIGGVNALFVL